MAKQKIDPKKKYVKTITLTGETIIFLEKEFPNLKPGQSVDEVVRKYKNQKGAPTNTHL